MTEAGRVAPDLARKLEAHYRIKLPVQHNWTGTDLARQRAQSRQHAAQTTSEEEREMAERSSGTADPQPAGEANTAAGNNNSSADANNSAAGSNNSASGDTAAVEQAEQRGRAAAQQSFRTLLVDCRLIESSETRDLTTVIREFADQQTHLREQAQDGVTYRKDLLDGALEEGVRALGNDFRAEDYRSLLTNAPIETIKRFRDDWKKVADDKLSGGRKTKDGAPEGESPNGVVEFKPPASVHRG
jgi:hypothetical protein